jgi:hypothetical protein
MRKSKIITSLRTKKNILFQQTMFSYIFSFLFLSHPFLQSSIFGFRLLLSEYCVKNSSGFDWGVTMTIT